MKDEACLTWLHNRIQNSKPQELKVARNGPRAARRALIGMV